MLITIALIILILYIAIKGNSIKGRVGESLVSSILEQIPGNKKIINNIMINDNGKSRQIDHIFISEKGIFIIETKNYAGNIYGKETSDEWKQYFKNRNFKLKNPIFQNYGHKKIVSKIINNEELVVPIVVFTTRCNLKVEANKNAVLYTTQLSQFIQNQPQRMKQEEIDIFYNQILSNRIMDEETINHHNENVRHYVKYKEDLKQKNICPRCYGQLIVKKGRYGDFLGCSNYPKCRYTKNI